MTLLTSSLSYLSDPIEDALDHDPPSSSMSMLTQHVLKLAVVTERPIHPTDCHHDQAHGQRMIKPFQPTRSVSTNDACIRSHLAFSFHSHSFCPLHSALHHSRHMKKQKQNKNATNIDDHTHMHGRHDQHMRFTPHKVLQFLYSLGNCCPEAHVIGSKQLYMLGLFS